MTIKKRLQLSILGGGGIALLVLGTTLGWTSHQMRAALQQGEVIAAIVRGVFELNTMTGDFLLQRNERARFQWRSRYASLAELLPKVDVEAPEDQASLDRIVEAHREIQPLFESLITREQAKDLAETETVTRVALEKQLVNHLSVNAQEMVGHASRLGKNSQKRVMSSQRNGFVTLLVLGAIVGTLVLTSIVWHSRRIVVAISELRHGSEVVARGNLAHRVDVAGEDELGDLARAFNAMTGNLSRARDDLEAEIAERQRAAQELKRSNEELQQFAYVASHDLQEPLRMVTSYVQLLERRYKGQLDKDASDFIGFAVDGATRMQRLIDDLLAYSRVGTHGKPLESVDCERAFDDVLSNLEVAIRESGAQVTHSPLPAVKADRSQFTQLLQNLVANAVKFRGDEAPEVHVDAERNHSEWVFSVRDNGIGIDPECFDRIFVIFQRLHGRGDYPGTGIGLAVSKRIVERHGGRIWVESAPGTGATFRFSIPEASGEEDAKAEPR